MEQSPATCDTGLDLGLDVSDTFGRLPPKQRTLLWLAYVEGYGHRDISRIMKVREGSVRVLLFRARSRFADVLRRAGFTKEDR
jgi:RNA polymerase sigma-70 factor (ECF subfamily)